MQRIHCEVVAGVPVDPFHLYIDLVARLAEGQVFLLDAARDEGDPAYRRSILGVCPVLEVQVKDGWVRLAAEPGLGDALESALTQEFGTPSAEPAALPPFASVVRGARCAWFAADPMAMLESIRRIIRDLTGDLPVPFSAGFLGYIGYDAVHYLESLPKTTLDDRGLPDIRLQWHAGLIHVLGEDLTLYDALPALARVVSRDGVEDLSTALDTVRDALRGDGWRRAAKALRELEEAYGDSPGDIVHDVSQAEYEENVRRAKEYIRAGDIFQVVLSRRIRVKKTVHPYVAYDRLRKLNPSPYMFMAEYPDMRLFGASPEVQFRAVGGVAEMKPIAGTSPGRGKTPEEDAQLVQRLLASEKDRAEHVMLVDLCRNDLGRVCTAGSVRVPELMVVETYSHVFHLVSRVVGRLRPDVSVFHALLATFPAGTLSGAPKIRAMEIIDELEHWRRGPYGGLIGMVDFAANANTAIIIRSVIEYRDTYYVQAGAGIVADSDPTLEWQECGHKAGAPLVALCGRHASIRV
ncbi:hypothetical protein GCM10010885_10370 [Alicyclobacillus cellulosilyticus]|uniref:Anthranilate synthase component 1 n=1 Tax=Alicyclobacillus cellulosilyticus TaxID=1003997 RepID=A0A917K6Y3_9BACL|nr:anthranilate synthase component I family protein [Alicyclobacillus cellulosilyticus]GGJ03022.1 hypothetical protein GCM10010885_10370 [Alicyclobacillus cellulosilyticus]